MTIGALMAMIAVVAVCLALFRQSTLIGGVGLVFLGTAAVRSAAQMWRRASRGKPTDTTAWIISMATSVAIAGLVYTAAIGAFFLTCFPVGYVSVMLYPGGPAGPNIGPAFALGILAAVVMAGGTLWFFWRVGD